jgi:hypothetical protein
MSTNRHHLNARPAVAAAAVLAAAACAVTISGSNIGPTTPPTDRVDGYVATVFRPQEPRTIEAAFLRESYRQGELARLRLWSGTRSPARLQIFRIGPERARTVGYRELRGVPVTPPREVGRLRAGRNLTIRMGDWPSGLYFARLDTRGGFVGFATFVVAPRRLGVERVGVVMPTRTWQAYNFRDDDGDGAADTWYADQNTIRTARLGRPFLNRGVPPHFRKYDLPFLRWLHATGKRVDVLAQEDLDETTGAALARAYDLLVFPGHHEYVTVREYDAVEGFRNRGGNLVLLSANNFYWRIDIRGGVMHRVEHWRSLGRPEAALLGVQYIGYDDGTRRGAWLVRSAAARSWIFDDVRLRNGNEFSNAGIEIDAVAPSSPRGTRILATIPDLFGPGLTAHMTYYETARGARVFAAGAFTLAGSMRQPAVQRLLENLWARLGPAEETARPAGDDRGAPR